MPDQSSASADPPLSCHVEDAPDSTVVRLRGSINLAGAAEVRATVLKVIAGQPDAIIMDLSGLTVSDELSLTVLPTVARHAAAWPGCPMVFVGASAEVTRILHTRGIDRHARMCRTWAEAKAAAREPRTAIPETHRYPPVPPSVSRARGVTVEACRRWGIAVDVTQRAEVVVAELVTNAIRHAATPVDLMVRCTARYLHLAVRDYDARPPRLTVPETMDAPHGRGLLIVDGFATAWGFTPTADGKVVWATLRHELSPGGSPT